MFQGILSADQGSFLKFHETDEGFAIQEYEDLTGVVERCKTEAIEGRITGPEHGIHAASIPLSLLSEWSAKKGIPFNHAMRDDKVLDWFLAEHPVFDLTQGRAKRYFNGA